ncbi:MAG: glycoside hydrolase family 3 N-terminal domain-containing protein [Coriobacteriales bacterium]|nr:glycoside hydrolase family 3 N-terminal domain-containing protein [Coriobacteriales bacterium]
MSTSLTRRSFLSAAAGLAALSGTACASPATSGSESDSAKTSASADQIMGSLSLEQKIAQMIVPAIRTWDGKDNNVTDLSAAPQVAEALRRHQYGGIILFGQNISSVEQTVRLIADLQANSMQGTDAKASYAIPYLIAADQEGGSVARITMGTRGTGSMAIGATADAASQNALKTGQVFGKELSSLGINVNLAPCADIIANLADPGMSTRVLSNDTDTVQELCKSFWAGVGDNGVITTFKHFPGAGDGADQPTAVHISLDELSEQGLAVFGDLVSQGADMIMTAATTFPEFDDQYVLADGKTKGYYPATMSPKIVTNMLREELGFGGVVVTDALEMDQFFEEPNTGDAIVAGGKDDVECCVSVAQKCIQAGCDILLIPVDLNSPKAASFYDDYIAGIAAKVQDGTIDPTRIDESVRRILDLKEKYELLEPKKTDGVDADVAAAQDVVGCEEHHAIERSIAEQAITLLKGDGVLPIAAAGKRLVIVGRTKTDANPIGAALDELMEQGVIDQDVFVDNRLTGKVKGIAEAATSIYVDCYFDEADGGKLAYSKDLSAAIAKADYVVCLSAVPAGLDALQDSDACMQGITRALKESSAAKAKFVLLSDNLPVDAARFADSDAIVCAYLSAGFGIGATSQGDAKSAGAYNANVPAAIRAIFGVGKMAGTLPIDIPRLVKGKDGRYTYSDEVMYKRGSGNGED